MAYFLSFLSAHFFACSLLTWVVLLITKPKTNRGFFKVVGSTCLILTAFVTLGTLTGPDIKMALITVVCGVISFGAVYSLALVYYGKRLVGAKKVGRPDHSEKAESAPYHTTGE